MSASNQRPALSICVPSHERGAFLPDLLDSIVRAIAELPPELSGCGVEVVISDNASRDDTAERVAAFAGALAIVYVQQTRNIGPDRNFLAVVEAARGDFCWLMGSDDVIEPGGLTHVLRAITCWDVAGFSVNYHKRSFDLHETGGVRPPVRYRRDAVIEGREQIYRNFAPHWGYLSGHVVRRDLWQAVCATKEQFAFLNAYVHIFVMGRMIERLPRWGYLHAVCVGWRRRNDSFVSGDHVERMMVDVRGYRAITERLFGRRSVTTAAVLNTVAGTHVLVHYRIAKVIYRSGRTLRRAALTLVKEYWRYRAFWTRLVWWIVLPAPALHGLWIGYQRGRSRLDPRFKIHPQARRKR